MSDGRRSQFGAVLLGGILGMASAWGGVALSNSHNAALLDKQLAAEQKRSAVELRRVEYEDMIIQTRAVRDALDVLVKARGEPQLALQTAHTELDAATASWNAAFVRGRLIASIDVASFIQDCTDAVRNLVRLTVADEDQAAIQAAEGHFRASFENLFKIIQAEIQTAVEISEQFPPS
jgi:hypothetical protein